MSIEFFPSHPAGSTGALVSDLLQSGTVGPMLSGVKLFGQLQAASILNPAEENSSCIIRGRYNTANANSHSLICKYTDTLI